jgi:hypothetical protein
MTPDQFLEWAMVIQLVVVGAGAVAYLLYAFYLEALS